MRERDCYRILKVPPGASPSEVQASYRRLVKRYHPDLTGRAGDGVLLSRIIEAYRVLQMTVPSSPENAATEKRSRSGRQGAGRARPATESRPETGDRTDVRGEPSLSELGRIAVSGRRPETRAFAVMRLANTGRRSAYAWIRAALFDDSEVVVSAAVDAVGNLGVLQAGGELAVVFARGEGALRRRVLDAVDRMSDIRPFRSVILSGMQDEDPEVRRVGLRLFRRLSVMPRRER